MKIINIDDNDAINVCIEAILSGKIVLFPTDTIYGLLCDATNIEAVNKIYAIKGRDFGKKLAIMLSDVIKIKDFCNIDSECYEKIKNLLPGAYTFVLSANDNAQQKLNWLAKYQDTSIGVRVPNSDILLKILSSITSPVAATSANLSGEKDTSIFENVNQNIINACDLVVKSFSQNEKKASTVINAQNSEFIILRK